MNPPGPIQLGELPTKFPWLCEKYDFDAGLDVEEHESEASDEDAELDALFTEDPSK